MNFIPSRYCQKKHFYIMTIPRGTVMKCEEHRMGKLPEYRIWKGLRGRCQNPGNPKFPIYGGRGIKVCERWSIFTAFFADMGPKPSPQHQIERLDNNGNYCPENCVWATAKTQARNRRSSRLLTFQGRTQTLAAWCEELGYHHTTVLFRLKSGWTVEKALSAETRDFGPGRPSRSGMTKEEKDKAILAILAEGPTRLPEIASRTSLPTRMVSVRLCYMRKEGKVKPVSIGIWSLV